jgi:hypothetical protein
VGGAARAAGGTVTVFITRSRSPCSCHGSIQGSGGATSFCSSTSRA